MVVEAIEHLYDEWVLGALAAAIDDLSVGVDAGELTELLALRDKLDAKIAIALNEFDAAGLWALEDRVSLRDWLRVQGRMTTTDALRTARTAQRLRNLPAVARAWGDGGLSSSHVDVVVGPLTDRRRPAFAVVEDEMVPLFRNLDTTEIRRVMREWVEAFDQAHPAPLPGEPDDRLHLSRTIDDRGELRGSFGATNTAVIDAALGIAENRDAEGELRLPSERCADALVDICRHYLDTHEQPERRRRPSRLQLVVTPGQLEHGRTGYTLDGDSIPASGIATLCCDSVISRVVHANGEILDLGRSMRSVPPKLFAVVAARDRGCRYPGCDRPPRWCDAHHVTPWWAGGPTSVTNLVLLCRRHHSRIHQREVHAKLLPDATFKVTLQTGRVIESHPPRPGPLL